MYNVIHVFCVYESPNFNLGKISLDNFREAACLIVNPRIDSLDLETA